MLDKINEFLNERTVWECVKEGSVYVVKNTEFENDEPILKSTNIHDVTNLCIEWWNDLKENGICSEEIEEVEEQFSWILKCNEGVDNMSLCSEVIGKIVKKETGKYTAIAEGIEYFLYSPNDYNLGDYVYANVLSYDEGEGLDDEGEFYLEDSNKPLAKKSDWLEQENI